MVVVVVMVVGSVAASPLAKLPPLLFLPAAPSEGVCAASAPRSSSWVHTSSSWARAARSTCRSALTAPRMLEQLLSGACCLLLSC